MMVTIESRLGLDNLDARRWMNATLVNMIRVGPDGTPNVADLIPFIDGGTEGFKGNARVILPRISSCFECTLDMFPPQTNFPLCTLATNPRRPEHCIEWARLVRWGQDPSRKDIKFDADDPECIQWVFEKALERARQYGIENVTLNLVRGVVKNIIPAVASTNALVAAVCAAEAFKIGTNAAPYLNNYVMFNCSDGEYSFTFETEKSPTCPVCASAMHALNVSPHKKLHELLDDMATGPWYACVRVIITSCAGDCRLLALDHMTLHCI